MLGLLFDRGGLKVISASLLGASWLGGEEEMLIVVYSWGKMKTIGALQSGSKITKIKELRATIVIYSFRRRKQGWWHAGNRVF